jgi:trehalose utilization protein
VRSSDASRAAATSAPAATIVLSAGAVKPRDRLGHHDYLAGCALLADLLRQTPGVDAALVREGWPQDERTLDAARSLVCYSGGGGKQPFLASPERIERIQRLVDRGMGLVMIHQAVSFPPELAARAAGWLGAAHVRSRSGRGHWWTQHRDFPEHPVTRGVRPWRIRDGWLNELEFAANADGVVPLVWAGPRHRGSRAGGAADVVCWAWERPGGGRSFCFSGLDAHSAWSVPGLRQLVVNGILWSAGLPVPAAGAPCAADAAAIGRYRTPRRGRGLALLAAVARAARRAVS